MFKMSLYRKSFDGIYQQLTARFFNERFNQAVRYFGFFVSENDNGVAAQQGDPGVSHGRSLDGAPDFPAVSAEKLAG